MEAILIRQDCLKNVAIVIDLSIRDDQASGERLHVDHWHVYRTIDNTNALSNFKEQGQSAVISGHGSVCTWLRNLI